MYKVDEVNENGERNSYLCSATVLSKQIKHWKSPVKRIFIDLVEEKTE